MENNPETPQPDPGENDRQGDRQEYRERPAPMSVFVLGWVFLRIGTTAFGGLGAAMAIIQRDLVERRQVLTTADVTESLTYTKLLPGSTVVQVVSYLGYRLRGWPGSAIATLAFVLPSAAMMVALGAGYVAAAAIPDIGPAVNGLTAAVIGVLLSTTYRIGRSAVKEPLTFAIMLAALLTGALLDISVALIVVAAGIIGTLLLSPPRQTGSKEGQ
jgi:chromate transporter